MYFYGQACFIYRGFSLNDITCFAVHSTPTDLQMSLHQYTLCELSLSLMLPSLSVSEKEIKFVW